MYFWRYTTLVILCSELYRELRGEKGAIAIVASVRLGFLK